MECECVFFIFLFLKNCSGHLMATIKRLILVQREQKDESLDSTSNFSVAKRALLLAVVVGSSTQDVKSLKRLSVSL